jgi:replicative DNA helicase
VSTNPPNVTEAYYAEESEMALLGCILHDARTLVDARALLTAKDMFLLRHQYIFEAMLSLSSREQHIDMITIAAELRKTQHFEDVGGHGYLAQLAGALVSTRNVESYAREIADKAYQRRLANAAAELNKLALEVGLSADERAERAAALLTGARREIDNDSEVVSMGAEMVEYMSAIEATEGMPAGISGLGTGFYDLDDILDGFQPRSLNLLGGRPGMGKSAIMMSVALAVAKWGGSVYYWSGEMPRKQLRERALGVEAGIDTKKLRRGLRANGMTPDELSRFVDATGKLGRLSLWLDDMPNITPARLHARIERIARRTKGGLDLIVLDYLQLMNPGVQAQNRNLELGHVTRFLKRETTKIAPVLAGAQLSRSLESRNDKRPILSDLRDSGELENDADVVMFAYRDVMYNPDTKDPNALELIVRKNRHWETGTVNLVFEPSFTRARNAVKAVT